MPYQLAMADPTGTAAIPTAYTVHMTTTFDMLAKTATAFYSVWRDKAARDAGLAPLKSFTRTVNAVALTNSLQTSADALVTGGQITELVGATVVA